MIKKNIYIYFHFSRDADETKDWIDDKNKALNTDNLGHDLHSVQALQRKHQGLERDLNALGKQVGLLLDGLSLSCSTSNCVIVFLLEQKLWDVTCYEWPVIYSYII